MRRYLIVAYASWRCRANRAAHERWDIESCAFPGTSRFTRAECLERARYHDKLSRMWEAMALHYL